jgi:hypothetical protein
MPETTTWWDRVAEGISPRLQLFTPGRGISGHGGKPFGIVTVDRQRIGIQSGRSLIPLGRECFDIIEKAFTSTSQLWLRVVSSHGEPLEGSADALIRAQTGSELARANYVCAILVYCGLVEYTMRGNRKGIQVPGGADSGTMKEMSAPQVRGGRRIRSARSERIEDLIGGFQGYLDYFTKNLKFSGPSIYFHLRTIQAIRTTSNYSELLGNVHFCEYLYATLASWGMHRMGKGGAKMVDFDQFKDSVKRVTKLCTAARSYRLGKLNDIHAGDVKSYLSEIFDNLVVMKSGARLVGNSKLMHHLLPDLVPPIDREHTLSFFFGNKNFPSTDERAVFLDCFDCFTTIAMTVGDKYTVFSGFNSSLPKIIDNGIMGYVMIGLGRSALDETADK